MDAGEKKALENIEEFGCHVLHVMAEDELPPFSYSVGITKSSGQPEAVVIGLKQPMAHFVINEYNSRVRAGEIFEPGKTYDDFLEGFPVVVESVDRKFYRDYFGWNLWLYKGEDFAVLQIVYPSTDGVWPWDAEASEWFRKWQPVLTSTPVNPGTLGSPN
jgi:hypothetical protein